MPQSKTTFHCKCIQEWDHLSEDDLKLLSEELSADKQYSQERDEQEIVDT